MKKIVISLLLLTNTVFAQKKIYVLDSVTKNILPFAEIEIGKSGVYSNEKGFFVFANDTIEKGVIHFLGYKSRLINLTKIDTVLLSPQQCKLDEIILSSKKKESKINFLHINKKYFGSFPLAKKIEILTIIIPKNRKITGKLESVSFKLDKITFEKNMYSKATKAFVRVNIYVNDSTQTKIYTSKPYEIKKIKKDLITINLSKKNIEITKKGLLFGIEYIGHVDEKGNFIKKSKMVVRPSLTDEKSILYSQSTFLRDFFTKKIFIKSLDNYFYSLNNKKVYSRNLSISFVVRN